MFSCQSDRQNSQHHFFQVFILEPILTPSGILPIGEDGIDIIDIVGDETDFSEAQDIGFSVLEATDIDFDEFEEIPFFNSLSLPQVNEQFDSGVFTVGDSGEVTIDFLFDGGKFKGELAIFSLENMDEFEPGSREFIQEASDRALSNSEQGYVVISDKIEGARFSGELGEKSWNSGEYLGEKTFQMREGDEFGVMFVPNGTVEKLSENPDANGSLRPLFSLSTANPDDSLQMGQIADVTGEGSTFVLEDMRIDGGSDLDYNDFIFRVKGATGEAIALDDVIDPDNDWRGTEVGQEILDYIDVEDAIAPLPIDPETGVEYKPGELLVKFAADLEDTDIQALIGGYDAIDIERLIPDTASSDSPLHQWRLLTFETETNVLEIRDEMLTLSKVEASELNAIRRLTWQPNDTDFEYLWALNNTGQNGGTLDADIDAPEAWDIQRGSKDIVVAVIDTGIDYNHQDLAPNMWKNSGEIAGNGIDDDGNGYVDDIYGYDFGNNDADPMDEMLPFVFDNGHGTHVAGIIGAVGDNNLGVVGVSPNVSLMALGVRDNASSFGQSVLSLDAIAQSIHYATDNEANIINASLGGNIYSQLEYDAISYANNNGVLLVAAAGNDTEDNDSISFYPANYNLPNIISVAATDNKDNLAYLSNFGANTVDLAAPGTQILSTLPGNSYGGRDGTSMATPYVAGAAALLLAENPTLSVSALKGLLTTGIDPLNSLQGKTISEGRLNVHKALETIDLNLEWSEQIGTSSSDGAWAIAVDGQGNIFLAGETSGDLGAANAGDTDIWLSKYDRNRNLQWTQQIGTSQDERIEKITVDSAGNVYMTGFAWASLEGNYGSSDIEGWVAKYDPDGNQVWLEQLSNYVISFYDLAVDNIGNVYVVGENTYFDIGQSGRYERQTSGLIVKFDTNGTRDWARFYSTDKLDISRGVTVDDSGNIYMTGWSQSGHDRNPLSPTTAGEVEAWVTKLNSNGSSEWVKIIANGSDNRATDVAVDRFGNVWVTGYTKGDVGGTNSGGWDVWLAQYNKNGEEQWKQQLGSQQSEVSWGIELDSVGNAYVTGMATGVLGQASSGNADAWVAKYDRNGNQLWLDQLGSNSTDVAFDLAIDREDSVYLTGYTFGDLGGINQGSADIWMAKYS
ncbi:MULTISPECIES: S8 family serine peptidase [Spirulina sp. CCY15215]|uniref:S8 family serine peptidase n=1 Tax=Spirulina sp. CCY15215 TaxID=2767591 RepID=UPI001950A0C5|nr:S8 family serine peptidase [Spirulina major]